MSCSLTRPPRAVLMMIAPFFILAMQVFVDEAAVGFVERFMCREMKSASVDGVVEGVGSG